MRNILSMRNKWHDFATDFATKYISQLISHCIWLCRNWMSNTFSSLRNIIFLIRVRNHLNKFGNQREISKEKGNAKTIFTLNDKSYAKIYFASNEKSYAKIIFALNDKSYAKIIFALNEKSFAKYNISHSNAKSFK